MLNLHQDLYKFHTRLSLSEKKKRKRAEKHEKRRRKSSELEKESETFTDDVAAKNNTDDMNVAQDGNNAENTLDDHEDSEIEITAEDDNSQHSSNLNAFNDETSPRQESKKLKGDVVAFTDNKNYNTEEASLTNQTVSEKENDADVRRRRVQSGGSTILAMQRRNETSPDARHRRRTGDTESSGAKTPVSGQRRQRFMSSEEAHFAMAVRSPPVACCSGINTVTGKIQ